jgi:hypothetical protein
MILLVLLSEFRNISINKIRIQKSFYFNKSTIKSKVIKMSYIWQNMKYKVIITWETFKISENLMIKPYWHKAKLNKGDIYWWVERVHNLSWHLFSINLDSMYCNSKSNKFIQIVDGTISMQMKKKAEIHFKMKNKVRSFVFWL